MYFLLNLLTNYGWGQQTLKIEKLSSRINSANYDETNPVVSRDGKVLYFTRVGHPGFKRTLLQEGEDLSASLNAMDYEKVLKEVYAEITNEKDHDPNKSPYNQDIWIALSKNGEFDHLEHPEHPVNNALPNSVCSLTPKDNEVVIVNEFYRDGSMYKGFSILSRNADGSWMHPKPLHIYEMNDYGSEVNLNMSADGEVIILSMNRKDGWGDNDLYVSFKVAENLYGPPVNLGPDINSKYREATPFIAADKRTLFFASNRSGGMGGMDIYMAQRRGKEWNQWTSPRLIAEPINSFADDGQPFFHEKSGYMYFSSRREGDSNIYRVKVEDILKSFAEEDAIALEEVRIQNEKLASANTPSVIQNEQPAVVVHEELPVQEVQIPAIVESMPVATTSNTVENPADIAPVASKEPFEIVCSIVDSRSGRSISGQIRFGLSSDKELSNTVQVPPGETSINIIANSYIRLLPEVDGYIIRDKLVHPGKVRASGKNKEQVIFFADPIAVNTQLTINPIYFQRSTPIVLERSYPELDRLANILKKHDNISILIAGHTDQIGEEELLYQLSRDRADAIKKYLIDKDIKAERIRTEGLGPSKLIIDSKDETSRALNRRVEIIIDKLL